MRREGGGRRSVYKIYPKIKETFLDVVDSHIAGDPMNSSVRWTYLNQNEMKEKLSERGIIVSRFVVRKLLRFYKLGKRKMNKSKTIKSVEHRDEQFNKIARLVKIYTTKKLPVLSVDVKQKEVLGRLYRAGSVYGQEALVCYDHSWENLKEGIVIPHGILDLKKNEGYINLNCSKDTSEFFGDSLLWWWNHYGSKYYCNALSMLILCDAGGSNSYRHYVFKQALQQLANQINMQIRVAHYPPYCSKYNPIEHRMFPHVTRALSGVPLDKVETVKSLIQKRAKTKTGLKVFANILNKTYNTGKRASQEFIQNMKIQFDKRLGQWNYQAVPLKI